MFGCFGHLAGNKCNNDVIVGTNWVRQAQRRSKLRAGQIVEREWDEHNVESIRWAIGFPSSIVYTSSSES